MQVPTHHDEFDELLQELLAQEAEGQFASFPNELALDLGLALLNAGRARTKPITIDIARNGQQIFHYAMTGTAPDNDAWIRRKNNVVNRFGHSSLYVGTQLQKSGQSMEEKYLLSSGEFAAHGGAFPLIIRDVGVVGTITVSGLPQREDHALVVTTIRQFL